MRADRLFSLLMILQTRGRVTAEALAGELEVSVRTIYRDMQALSAAGIPVYAERGPGGGCRLVEQYRTTLTGLTDAEARSLYLLDIPAPLESLGVGRHLKAALLKLYASLPAYRRAEGPERQRIYLDWAWWGQDGLVQPVLELLYDAVMKSLLLRLTYIMFNGQPVEQTVAPLGLVSKAGMWYLVFRSGEKTSCLSVADLLGASPLEEGFERPAGFDLPAYWQQFSQTLGAGFNHFEVQARAHPAVLPLLKRYFSFYPGRLGHVGELDPGGCVALTLYYETFEAARSHLLALGDAVEVLAPPALRLSIADFAAHSVALYERSRVGPGGW